MMDDTVLFTENCDALTNGQTVAEILQRALAVLQDEDRWCREYRATDAEWNRVDIVSPAAVRFSIEGAVGRVANDVGIIPPFILRYLDEFVLYYLGLIGHLTTPSTAGIMEERDVAWFNDSYMHEHIVAFLEQAHRRAYESGR